MADVIELYASFEDGKLIIERKDQQEISIITHEDLSEDCIEVLEYGSTGQTVKAMQCLLNAHGHLLDPDGIYGPLTQTELIIFQDQYKLPANGTCDILTWEKLIRS